MGGGIYFIPFNKVIPMKINLCSWLIAAGISTLSGVTLAVPPLEVLTINSGGTAPVQQANGGLPANFVGYFSPHAGESYTADGKAITTPTSGGGRFGDARSDGTTHTGVDIVGWVEKVSTGGNPPGYIIHLFDTTWSVYPTIDGIVGDKGTSYPGSANESVDNITIEHYSPDNTSEEYWHLNDLTSKPKNDDITHTDKLGTLKEGTKPGELVHLHYATKDQEGNYMNPIATGNRGLTQSTVYVPEPATCSLLLGGIATLFIQKRYPR